MKTRDRLFACSNQIRINCTTRHLVQLLIKIIKLSSFSHLIFTHEKWSGHRRIVECSQKIHSIMNQRNVKLCTNASQKVASMTHHFDTSFWIVTVNHCQQFMMMSHMFDVWHCKRTPFAFHLVFAFIVRDRYTITHQIANQIDGALTFGQQYFHFFTQSGNILFYLWHTFFSQFFRFFHSFRTFFTFCSKTKSNFFRKTFQLSSCLIKGITTLFPFLIQSYHFIHKCRITKSFFLRFSNNFWIFSK
mmetsp:Transcript_15184/g.22736  ORF Transcript_15184/g.22736 Transcript_15184/m.22736 type:complete len:246 (-) Transcript_15184:119-856(-)